MATNEELEKMIKELQEQVNSLQDGFNKYQKLLTQEVETKQLKVSESIHIADRDISSKLDTIEQRLNAHDANITTAQGTANNAVTRANNAQDTATKIENDVAPLVNSQALQQFASLVKYKVRPRDGYGFLVFPSELNIDAWDVHANGQFYSGHGFVLNTPNEL